MTEADATKLQSDLSNIAAKLNKVSDNLNEKIASEIKELRTFNIGLEVWIEIRNEQHAVEVEDERGDTKEVHGSYETQLGWAREGGDGDWNLLIADLTFRGDLTDSFGNEEWREVSRSANRNVLDSSRNDRIAAWAGLPTLKAKLLEEAQAAVKMVQGAEGEK